MIYVYKNHKLFKAKGQEVNIFKNGKNGVETGPVKSPEYVQNDPEVKPNVIYHQPAK